MKNTRSEHVFVDKVDGGTAGGDKDISLRFDWVPGLPTDNIVRISLHQELPSFPHFIARNFVFANDSGDITIYRALPCVYFTKLCGVNCLLEKICQLSIIINVK